MPANREPCLRLHGQLVPAASTYPVASMPRETLYTSVQVTPPLGYSAPQAEPQPL